jgi:hypothetical protein
MRSIIGSSKIPACQQGLHDSRPDRINFVLTYILVPGTFVFPASLFQCTDTSKNTDTLTSLKKGLLEEISVSERMVLRSAGK